MAKITPAFYRYGNLPESYVPAHGLNDLDIEVPVGQRCGNCEFYDGSYCAKWEEFVAVNYWCKSWENDDNMKRENEE